MQILRQGEVYLFRLDKPITKQLNKVKKVILAEGEVTGHKHQDINLDEVY